MADPLPYGVTVVLEADVLHCTLTADHEPDASIKWTLHRGDFNPRRASHPVFAGPSWTVEMPDMTNGYAVRAEVGGIVYQSPWVHYFNTESVRRYQAWRSEWKETKPDAPTRIPLFRYEEPFDNVAFVCYTGNQLSDQLAKFSEAHGLQHELYRGIWQSQLSVISRHGSVVDSSGTRYLFSGLTRTKDRLIVGMDDVKIIPDVRRLHDEVGEFHLLTWDEESLEFGHDYIGQGHLFTYHGDNMFAAANGLHLLASLLTSLGVELEVNEAAAKMKFFSTSYPFEFQHGLATDFDQIQRVSVYERVEITRDGVVAARTQLWHDNADGELTDEVYENLLFRSAEDIVDNVRIALDHPRFENVVVELSAGLDSRMVYSALTRLPASEKVRISTRRGAEERTAVAINNLYGYAWDNLARTYSYDSSENTLPSTSHSVFMDGYYIESMFKVRANFERPTLVLTGHGGEAFSRVMSIESYFARDFSGEIPPPLESEEEILANVIRFIGNHQVWLEAGQRYFPENLHISMAESPSENFGKRFEDLYVSERNPFVCGSVFRGAMSGPQWRPLHSKALYRLRALWFQRSPDYRIQYDLIRQLNPLISEVPYIKAVELARKNEYYQYRPPFTLTAPIEYSDNSTDLVFARSESSARARWLPSKPEFDATKSAIESYEESAESFLTPLGFIMDLDPRFEEMGLPLFSYIDRVINRDDPKGFTKRHNVRNKLHILLQEMLIIHDSKLKSPDS